MAVVAEPRQWVGEGEPDRTERAQQRALVELDREQRADERDRKQRRALPEDDERQHGRAHEREREHGLADARCHEVQPRALRPAGDDSGDQEDVDRVADIGRYDHAGRGLRGLVALDRRDHEPRADRGDCEGKRVVGDPHRWAAVEDLHHGRGREDDEHAGCPAEEHDRRQAEDEGERDAVSVEVVDGHRKPVGEQRGGEERRDAREIGGALRRRRERRRRGDEREQPGGAHRHHDGVDAPAAGPVGHRAGATTRGTRPS